MELHPHWRMDLFMPEVEGYITRLTPELTTISSQVYSVCQPHLDPLECR